MGLFSSIGKIFKSAAPALTSFIPGIGPTAAKALSAGLEGFNASQSVEEQNRANVSSGREAAAFNANQAQINRDFNRQEAYTARSFSSLEARKSRMWSAHLSNTAHRRQVADLRAAGVNPILSSKYGGASVPPVAVAATSQAQAGAPASRTPARHEEVATKGINTALAVTRQQADLEVLKEQAKLTREKRNTEKAMQQELTTRGAGHSTRAALDAANTRKVETEERHLEAQILHEKAQTKRSTAETARIKTATRNEATRLKGLLLEEEIDSTEYGRKMRQLARAAQSAPSVSALFKALRK